MSRINKRVEQIKEKISVAQLLHDLGYSVMLEYEREQQFPCNLHGSGLDNKPSARYYPGSDSWYCFACNKSRDVIETIKDIHGKSFYEAVTFLEDTYALPSVPWEESDYPVTEPPIDQNAVDYDTMNLRTSTLLTGLKGDLPFETLFKMWNVYDMIDYNVSKGQMTNASGLTGLTKLHSKVMHILNVKSIK